MITLDPIPSLHTPSILNVSIQCLATGEEAVAIIAFDKLMESPAPLLGDSVNAIVLSSLEVCSNKNVKSSSRHQVAKPLKEHRLLDPILHVLCSQNQAIEKMMMILHLV